MLNEIKKYAKWKKCPKCGHAMFEMPSGQHYCKNCSR